ncbi:CAMK/CAMK1 protein kinase [Saprolegnia diclina VS20]|uniref:CAMK/CAMK1 protein kinase n=1 Tax=Saprolegnia diclina (strain VS20) TaxID=1156394 RepID=T0RM64_SAPDV|nr:CAMK/CAMK1 protein kinase [Saprolegnia diclina VS20]EQC31047.1 CAMK/CAMK1 protein kinase [Saprolegnia diclina VS20]|eukprot:XP_008615486.1 CAMK/CAMK1 protein kinase [Saprolegnia diclina VS20]
MATPTDGIVIDVEAPPMLLPTEELLSPTSKQKYRAGSLTHRVGLGFVKSATFKHKYFRLRDHGLLGYAAQDAHVASLEVLFSLFTLLEVLSPTTFVLRHVNVVQTDDSWLKVEDPVVLKAASADEASAWITDIGAKLELLKRRDDAAKHRKASLIPTHNAEDLLFSATPDPPYYRTFLHKYVMMGEIGEGSFSVVRKGVDRMTAEVCAIKCSKHTPSLLEEVAILKLVSHPNIVGLHGVYKTDDMFYIVMDYMADGDLCDRLIQMTRFPEDDVRRIIAQVASAIQHIHALNIIHRDIKPENILLHKDSVKLADFGLAKRILDPTMQFQKGCGTPEYAAPELLYGRPYGTQSDLFSLGVVTYVLLFGAFPFTVASAAALQQIQRFSEAGDMRDMSCLHPSNPQWQCVSPDAQDVILRLLAIDPAERMTATDLLAHPWLASTLSELPAKDDQRRDDCVHVGFRELLYRGMDVLKHNQSGKDKAPHASVLRFNVATQVLSWTPASTLQQNPKKHFNAKDHPRSMPLKDVTAVVPGGTSLALAPKVAKDAAKDAVCLSILTEKRSLDLELPTTTQRDMLVAGLRRLLLLLPR